MGVSTDGILAYGYDLGGEEKWHVKEWDNHEYRLNVSWYKDENEEWDGIWEAATNRHADGWSAEIRIPIQTLSFNSALREWDFNVERRIESRLETMRWAFPARQYRVIQTSRAGLLTE